jgi:hypothetical protein
LPAPEPKLVVEGNIEPGQPPIVLLTRNIPFFGTIDLNDLDAFQVHDADMEMIVDGAGEPLVEYCLSELPPELLPLAAELLGVSEEELSDLPFDICLYTVDFLGGSTTVGEVGKRYRISAAADGMSIESVTTIPNLIPMDSIWWEPHPDPETDTLVRLWVRYTDPDTLGNFTRYFTKRNSEPFYPGVNSVFDDLFINGQQFDFTLDRGQSRNDGFEEDYGYFKRGDTVILKWCAIDGPHFDFWSTLEFDANTAGPFSSATVVNTNIEGGLGIWGGYGASYDTLFIAE